MASNEHSPVGDGRGATAGFRLDVIAGLTAAAVVLPKAMAYATVAGLPVSVGLYTAFVPMIIYALLGTSRVLSVSSTTTGTTKTVSCAMSRRRRVARFHSRRK